MNIETLRNYCRDKKGVTEDFPFDDTSLVFKVAGKMFCLTDLEDELAINVKNNPEKNIEMREKYTAVKPGYHMNKKHWNTVQIDGSIPDAMIFQMIDESYDLVVNNLSKKVQQELSLL